MGFSPVFTWRQGDSRIVLSLAAHSFRISRWSMKARPAWSRFRQISDQRNIRTLPLRTQAPFHDILLDDESSSTYLLRIGAFCRRPIARLERAIRRPVPRRANGMVDFVEERRARSRYLLR